jgi:hypothetical protein
VRHAHADWWIGSLYGRVMPARLRKYLRQSVTPELRQAIRGRISRIVTAAGRGAEPLRTLPVLLRRRRESEVVHWQGRAVLATIVEGLTPLVAKRRNFALVRDALESAGIPYFVVRSPRYLRFCVAVPARYRSAVAKVLSQEVRKASLYVQRVEHNGELRLATSWLVRAATRDDYFLIARLLADPTRCLVLGGGYGCEIEFWEEGKGRETHLIAPRPNPCTESVSVAEPVKLVEEPVLSPFNDRYIADRPKYPSRSGFAEQIYSDVTFPVDVVYTWVDGDDPAWQERRARVAGVAYHPYAANSARFISHNELRYSIRSVRMNMPWVRNIYVVTDQQVPSWLDSSAPGIRVVDHREIFADPSALPTFNSHAIESQLHRIEGLAEHFLYLNDDVCIGMPLIPDHFFLSTGVAKYFPSPALVPFGDPAPKDIPSSVAGKNNRRLLTKEFGVLLTHKMKHAPHALRRSVLAEIEERFATEHQQTAANRFRDITDISVTSSLHHYYAYLTGRAVPSRLNNAYFDLALPQTAGRLRQLLARRNRQVFCLNDTTTDSDRPDIQRSMMIPFLEAYFPILSVHEVRGPDAVAGPLPGIAVRG